MKNLSLLGDENRKERQKEKKRKRESKERDAQKMLLSTTAFGIQPIRKNKRYLFF